MSPTLRRAGLWALALAGLSLAGCRETPATDPAANPATQSAIGTAAPAETALAHARKHLDPSYVCPMHPQIVRDQPGTCPICGMDLVAKIPEPDPGPQPVVTVSGQMIQSMGVRTEPVQRGTLWKYIRTVGRVAYDETRLAHLHPRASGWVEQLQVRAEGDAVQRGQVLGRFYAPDILSAQVDFLVALRQYAQSQRDKVDKARNLLRLLDVPEGVIKDIERTGETRNTVPLLAPIGGVVTRLGMREGMYVTPASEVVTIADLSQVWVLADVFEHQLDWLRPGLKATMHLPAHPGREWPGAVDYLYPELDPRSRTLRVRLKFPNPEQLLRPNLFAEVVIYGGPRENALNIPRDALIVTGEREAVIKALGEGRFQPVDVVTGMQRGGRVEILHGLAEGDRVVVSGQFLIDSEASLQASFRRLSEVPGHAH
jgi:Cu(I)/Ag(I) efflux system membrane fusion protein